MKLWKIGDISQIKTATALGIIFDYFMIAIAICSYHAWQRGGYVKIRENLSAIGIILLVPICIGVMVDLLANDVLHGFDIYSKKTETMCSSITFGICFGIALVIESVYLQKKTIKKEDTV